MGKASPRDPSHDDILNDEQVVEALRLVAKRMPGESTREKLRNLARTLESVAKRLPNDD